jgi:SAM-dependent methyltransferase
VLLPIARNGVPITGIDQSPTMLGRARARLAEEDDTIQAMVRLEQADMRSFDLGDRFALAMIPFRPFQHLLTVADQLSTLRSIHRHLEPGGHLVFDVFNTDLSRIVAGPSEESEDTSDTALSDGRHFRRTGRVTAIDAVQQISDVEMIYYVSDQRGNTERLVHSFRMRWYTHYEIEHLLERCGYGVKAVYGNFDRSELKDGSPDMIFVAERR